MSAASAIPIGQTSEVEENSKFIQKIKSLSKFETTFVRLNGLQNNEFQIYIKLLLISIFKAVHFQFCARFGGQRARRIFAIARRKRCGRRFEQRPVEEKNVKKIFGCSAIRDLKI